MCVRGTAPFGAWRTVRVHTTLCLCPLYPHCAMGGARGKSDHQLCQDWLLCHRHLSHQTLLRGKSTQVSTLAHFTTLRLYINIQSCRSVSCPEQYHELYVYRQILLSAKCLKSQTVLNLDRVTAEVKHNPTSTIVCKAQGEWNGTLEFTYSSGETKVIDTSKLPVIKKKIRPLEKQGQDESR